MEAETFDRFWKENKENLVSLLKALIPDIQDEYKESEEDLPSIHITISINDDCSTWSYQTGNNSYTGSCYGDPYWGIGDLYRESDCNELAEELINNLASAIEFEN